MIAFNKSFLGPGTTRWKMLSLIFLATALNYIDRAALGILQPLLSKELGWSAMEYANINFWFQAGYAVGYFLQGSLIDRFGVKRVFFIAVILWSIATGAHGFVSSASGFMLCRLILGLTEAANYPAGLKISRTWFPASERGIAAGIFNSGTHIGAIITPLALPALLIVGGWQAVFFVLATLGLAWSVAWIKLYYDPAKHPFVKPAELDYINSETHTLRPHLREIFKRKGTWVFSVAFTLTAPVFWFYLYWLPSFLNKQYDLEISITQIGLPLIIIYLSADVGSLMGGFASSALIKAGFPPVGARLRILAVCAICTASVGIANTPNIWLAVTAIAVGLGAGQAWIANLYSILMDFTPQHLVSTTFGFGGMCAAVGGMLMTQVVGQVLTATNNNYETLFMAIPALYLIAFLILLLFAPRSAADH